MPQQTRQFLIGGAALAIVLAIPAIAQDRPESILPPGFGDPAPTATPAPSTSQPSTTPSASSSASPAVRSIEESAIELVDALTTEEAELAKPAPQVEYPAHSRRDPHLAGTLDPETYGLGARPWGAASG